MSIGLWQLLYTNKKYNYYNKRNVFTLTIVGDVIGGNKLSMTPIGGILNIIKCNIILNIII